MKEIDGVKYTNPYSRKGNCFQAAAKYFGYETTVGATSIDFARIFCEEKGLGFMI